MPEKNIGTKLTFGELEQKFADLSVSEKELAFYFTGDAASGAPFRPTLRPDPNKVIMGDAAEHAVEGALAFDWLNGHLTWRRQRRFERERDKNDGRPMLVFEGDSWFQFPLLLDDVVDVLFDHHKRVGWCMSAAGAELAEMVGATPASKPEYKKALEHFRNDWKVFLFSGGGNDIVGAKASGKGSVLEDIIAPFEPGRTVDNYISNDAYAANLEMIEQHYRALLSHVSEHYPGRPIILHGYAHAWPGGFAGDPRRVIYAKQDQWIGRYMRGRKLRIADHGLQHAIIGRMVDDFNAILQRLCGGNVPGGVYKDAYHVDVRPLFGHVTDWNDELHPTETSFVKVAAAIDQMVTKALAQSGNA